MPCWRFDNNDKKTKNKYIESFWPKNKKYQSIGNPCIQTEQPTEQPSKTIVCVSVWCNFFFKQSWLGLASKGSPPGKSWNKFPKLSYMDGIAWHSARRGRGMVCGGGSLGHLMVNQKCRGIQYNLLDICRDFCYNLRYIKWIHKHDKGMVCHWGWLVGVPHGYPKVWRNPIQSSGYRDEIPIVQIHSNAHCSALSKFNLLVQFQFGDHEVSKSLNWLVGPLEVKCPIPDQDQSWVQMIFIKS